MVLRGKSLQFALSLLEHKPNFPKELQEEHLCLDFIFSSTEKSCSHLFTTNTYIPRLHVFLQISSTSVVLNQENNYPPSLGLELRMPSLELGVRLFKLRFGIWIVSPEC
ncbi:hypothetical protein SLE2022_242390 [Rubroshorea leprosula]